MKKTNTTDLHIQYHMETGDWHEWRERYTGQFHSTENYSREYAKWIEEKYLELLNNQKNQEEEIDECNRKIEELENEVEFLYEEQAGEDI